jgi:hypothetical protein
MVTNYRAARLSRRSISDKNKGSALEEVGSLLAGGVHDTALRLAHAMEAST